MRIGTQKHIAEIDPWEYFSPVFNSEKDAQTFVEEAKKNKKSRIIVHQCARMLYLADKIHQRGRPSFDILFFIIIAEATAKIKFDFTKEGDSKKYVYKFFEKILTKKEKNLLEKSFIKNPYIEWKGKKYLSLEKVIELLYEVRCDIVHRGIYFDNIFLNDTSDSPTFHWKNNQFISAEISTNDLRKIILEGVIKACRR